jgi:hypothetical protein
VSEIQQPTLEALKLVTVLSAALGDWVVKNMDSGYLGQKPSNNTGTYKKLKKIETIPG